MKELLLRMLTTTFRRYIHHTTLKKLKHSLLNTLTRNVTSNRRIVTLTCNLIDLINEYNTALCSRNIKISLLKKSGKNALHVLTNISCLSKNCSINDCERHIEKLCYSLGHQGLSSTGRSYDKHIRLLKFEVSIVLEVIVKTLIMVVNSNRKQLLSSILTDYILIKMSMNVHWLVFVLYLDILLGRRSLAHSGKLIKILPCKLHTLSTDVTLHTLKKKRNLIFPSSTEHAIATCMIILLGHTLFSLCKNLVNHTILKSLLRCHPEITVSISINLLKRLS